MLYIPYNNHCKGGDYMARGQLSEKNTTMSFAIPKDLKKEIGGDKFFFYHPLFFIEEISKKK